MQRTEKLKKLIENTGLNLKAFSEKAGIPYTTLRSMLERGISNASVNNVIKVCKTLGIKVEDLDDEANCENEKEKCKPTTIAAHIPDGVELTEEDMKQINDFIQFVISKKKERK